MASLRKKQRCSWVIINNKDSVLKSHVQDGLLRMKTLPKHSPATQAYIRILSAVLTGNNIN